MAGNGGSKDPIHADVRGRALYQIGGRDADVRDGIITWESQQTDYPSVGADRPEYKPRGCPRGAAFSWYTYSPTRVRYPYARGVFSGVALLAIVQAFQPALVPVGTAAFLGMACLLGAASGAVFALVGKLAPADKVGAITGLVGAAGGLGGFVPPLVMGAIYGIEQSYAIGLMLLSDVALAAAVYTGVKMAGLARRDAEVEPST